MRKTCFFVIGLLSATQASVAQTYTWNGSVSTDYQVSTNWTPARTAPSATDTLSFNAVLPVNITNVAGQTVRAIEIAAGTGAVTFSTNIPSTVLNLGAPRSLIFNSAGKVLAGDFLTIQLSNAALFTISSGVFGIAPGRGGKIRINGALTLAGGTLDIDVAGTGGTTINGPNGSITYSSGSFLCTNASSINWAAGSNYYHNVNGAAASAIPAGTWQTGSVCNITGMNTGTTTPSGFTGINFAGFTWNCPTQIGNIDFLPSGTVVNIKEAFTVAGTGSGTAQLRVSAGKATVNAGSFIQTGGSLILQAGADTTTLNVSGNFSHTAGILDGVAGTLAGTALLDLKGNVSRGGNAIWRSTSSSTGSQLIYRFSGTSVQSVDVTAGTWNSPNAGRCNIVNSNTDIINGINLSGIFRVYNSGSSLPASLTMNGVITGGGGVTYTGLGTGGTSLIYASSFFQTASAIEFPTTNGPFNLTINNTLGVNFPPGLNRTIAGRLSLVSGNLAIGIGDTLTLSNTSLANQLSNSGGFITTGTLGRYFPTTGLPTAAGLNSVFPFGSGVNDRALHVYFSSASLTGGTGGTIYVSHSPIVDVTPISLTDNNPIAITLNKRTNTSWKIGTVNFNLGGGGVSLSMKAVGANIGSVNNFINLRLTDAVTPNYGILIPTTGSNALPTVGKSGLTQTSLNKTLYIGSDNQNALIIITFTWTGLGANSNWTTPGNWTGSVPGYPSSSTEIAIITNTAAPRQPTINTGTSINVYQLTVGGGMTLTMAASAGINVYDNIPSFAGTAVFSPSSTFGYASSSLAQNILSLPYGNLAVSGTAAKTLPASVSVTGDYIISGVTPAFANSTFIYAGTGAQRITGTTYYNLTITGNRVNALITLGNGVANNIIDIQNIFNVSSLSNYTIKTDFNTVRFSSPGTQTIPGFLYGQVTNSGGTRILDPLGSTDPAHVISCRSLSRAGSVTPYTVINSKVKFYVSGTINATYLGSNYHDFEISGNLNGYTLDFFNATRLSITGKFTLPLVNFKQGTANIYDFEFNGTGDQTIPAFKPDITTNTPAFKFSNVYITGGNRNVTLGGNGTDTIAITGSLIPETSIVTGNVVPFVTGKGFIVAGSTVNFSRSGSEIPVLKPMVPAGNNYNNIVVSSGTRLIDGNMTIGGNVTVSAADETGASLTIGNGRAVRIIGDLSIADSIFIPNRIFQRLLRGLNR